MTPLFRWLRNNADIVSKFNARSVSADDVLRVTEWTKGLAQLFSYLQFTLNAPLYAIARLDLSNCVQVGEEDLRELDRFPALKELKLDNCHNVTSTDRHCIRSYV